MSHLVLDLYFGWKDAEACVAQGGFGAVLARLLFNKANSSPFEGFGYVQVSRQSLDACLRRLGKDPARRKGDRKTEINFRRMASMLEGAKDPDWQYLHVLAERGLGSASERNCSGLLPYMNSRRH